MSGIFKAYDIRGVYPDELDEQIVKNIGRAFGTLYNEDVYVGCDARETGPSLKKAFVAGLVSTGCRVVDVGVVTTPVMIFCAGSRRCPAVIVTASHSPKDYNGLKFFDSNAAPLSYESGIQEIQRIFESRRFKSGEGCADTEDVVGRYSTHLLRNLRAAVLEKKVVVDCFNGGASMINPYVLQELGCEVVKIRCRGDGDFPEDGPDPSIEKNLTELKKKVVETRADAGFAFDGDGDRLSVVDSEGKLVSPRLVFSLLIQNASFDNPGMKVVHDVLTSDTVDDITRKGGGLPVVCRVGHTYISQRMMKEKAAIAGELSGHYYFKETFFGDDALFATMKLLQFLNRTGKSLEQATKNFPETFSKSFYTRVSEDRKLAIIERITEDFSDRELDMLDGVKVKFERGWMIFRPSNTGPKMSIAYESTDEKEFKKIEAVVNSTIERYLK